VTPGALGVSVNRDTFWAPGAVSAMDTLVADDLQQIEAMKPDGFFTAVREAPAELSRVVAGLAPGRRRAGDRILVFNLGVALEDLATAVELYRRARARGIGTALAV
jgi:ornithine cyclodeaminase/alanine dehydrogenase-like protein (mu-crystallin family)